MYRIHESVMRKDRERGGRPMKKLILIASTLGFACASCSPTPYNRSPSKRAGMTAPQPDDSTGAPPRRPVETQVKRAPMPPRERPVVTSPPAVGSKEAWWSLEVGMTRDQVERLLGPPDSKTMGGYWESWNYQRRQSSGYVRFRRRTRTLDEWSDPF